MPAAAIEPPRTNPLAAPTAPAAPAAGSWDLERAQIDASARVPVLVFFFSALAWLLIATIYNFIATIKLSSPGFLADAPQLSYGRVVPAANLAFNYGWASLAGMGVALWLMARLCRVQIRFPGFLLAGALFWNVGLFFGVIGVLTGWSRKFGNTGLENMDLPRASAWIMFVGYLFIGLWGGIAYRLRKTTTVFISVWYLLGAFFWFFLLFLTANTLVGLSQVHGVMQNVIAAWYSHNLLGYWFTAIGLAAAYYLIPKVIDRPIHSYNLATIGFWSWAVFSGLAGMTRLSGGPVPAWLVTLSIASSIMMIVPLATVATNFFKTMHGNYHMVYHSPTIRFTFFGAICFSIAAVVGLIASLRSVDRVLHFTQYLSGYNDLVLYTFFSMVMFGAIYYITPRLTGCEWLSSTLIKVHFLGAAYGGGMAVATLLLAGVAAGMGLAEGETTFAQVVQFGQFYLPGRVIALVLVTIGHSAFGLHFLLMLLRIGQPAGSPTLFAPLGEEKH